MAQPQFTGLDLLSTIACENALNGVATSSSSRSSRSGYTTPPDGDGGSQRSFTAASEGVDVSGGPGTATARLDVFGAVGEPGSRLLHPPRPLFGSGSSCSPFRPFQPFQSQIVHPPPHSVVHSGGPVHGGHHAYAPKGHPHRYHHGAPGAPGSVRMGSNHPSPYRSPEMHAQPAPAHSPPPILPFPPTCEPSKLMPYLERTRRTSKPGGVAPLVGNFTAPTWAAAAAAAGAAGGSSGGGAAATQCGGRHHPHSGATSPMSCVSLESNGSHGSAAAAAAVVVTRSRQGVWVYVLLCLIPILLSFDTNPILLCLALRVSRVHRVRRFDGLRLVRRVPRHRDQRPAGVDPATATAPHEALGPRRRPRRAGGRGRLHTRPRRRPGSGSGPGPGLCPTPRASRPQRPPVKWSDPFPAREPRSLRPRLPARGRCSRFSLSFRFYASSNQESDARLCFVRFLKSGLFTPSVAAVVHLWAWVCKCVCVFP